MQNKVWALFFLFLFLTNAKLLYAKKEISINQKYEKQISQSLLSAFFPNKDGVMADSGFQSAGCHIPTEKWVKLLVFGKPFEHEFKFGEKCDLQGSLKAAKTPFPVEFEVKHFLDFKKIQFLAEPDFAFNEKTQSFRFKVKSKNAKLSGSPTQKKPVVFDFNYSSDFDMAGRGNLNPKLVVKIK